MKHLAAGVLALAACSVLALPGIIFEITPEKKVVWQYNGGGSV